MNFFLGLVDKPDNMCRTFVMSALPPLSSLGRAPSNSRGEYPPFISRHRHIPFPTTMGLTTYNFIFS